MDNLMAYLERLELIAFFSGFPLLYAFIAFLAGPAGNRSPFKRRIFGLLGYAYGLVGLAYFGFVLKNWNEMQIPLLKGWAFLSILFFIPALAKRPWLCLLHSLPFFYLFAIDLFNNGGDRHLVSNGMKLYTDSLLIQAGALLALFITVKAYKAVSQRQPLARH